MLRITHCQRSLRPFTSLYTMQGSTFHRFHGPAGWVRGKNMATFQKLSHQPISAPDPRLVKELSCVGVAKIEIIAVYHHQQSGFSVDVFASEWAVAPSITVLRDVFSMAFRSNSKIMIPDMNIMSHPMVKLISLSYQYLLSILIGWKGKQSRPRWGLNSILKGV